VAKLRTVASAFGRGRAATESVSGAITLLAAVEAITTSSSSRRKPGAGRSVGLANGDLAAGTRRSGCRRRHRCTARHQHQDRCHCHARRRIRSITAIRLIQAECHGALASAQAGAEADPRHA
ncbi:hypothetical protein H4S06_005770, partial [Coemansia sp. BCRC 34490]